MTATEESARVHASACILCECNCGIQITVQDRTFARIRGDERHPGSAGYTCEKALRLDRYQNGRHRLSSPLRRRADGTHEEVSWETAITEIAQRLAAGQGRARRRLDLLLRRWRAGQPPRRHPRPGAAGRARGALLLQRPGAGEDRRDVGRRQALRRPHPRRRRERRGGALPGQEPVAVARLSASTADPARDRSRPRPVDDRGRSPSQRDRRDGRVPSAGPPRHRRLVPVRDARHRRAGRTGRPGLRRRAHHRNGGGPGRTAGGGRGGVRARSVASTRSCCARVHAASPPLPVRAPSRTSGCSSHRTARWCPI